MNLSDYFGKSKGRGVLATADSQGKVDAAVYASPHILDGGSVAFIMRDRLTHVNLQSNPHAAFLFMEDGPGYKGIRLFLTKIREEQDSELLFSLRRKDHQESEEQRGPLFLVLFSVDKVLSLIGSGEE
jgi:hypothetical protein